MATTQLIGQRVSEVGKDRAEPLTPLGQAPVLSPGSDQADKATLGPGRGGPPVGTGSGPLTTWQAWGRH